MSATQKLTKKQKKGVAFRERKTGKRKDKDGIVDVEDNAVPVMEEQDLAGLQGAGMEVEDVAVTPKESTGGSKKSDGGKSKGKGKGKEKEGGELVAMAGKSKKRKRDAEGEEIEKVEEKGSSSKRKKADPEGTEAAPREQKSKNQKNEPKQRFILFVGNLKYTTSKDAIQAHFAACDPPPTIRLLTPKANNGVKSHKTKGCAFLEFTHRNALQQALKLHQSSLDGRMINVELTAGGGGKSEKRLEKVKERNKVLFGQRKERIEKSDPNGESIPTLPEKPQRYSATSGIEQFPTTKRTWTVGDVVDDTTHRGGQRHARGSKGRPNAKEWGTGVNAIPVG